MNESIILLNQDYFVYSVQNPGGHGTDVMFHSRVKKLERSSPWHQILAFLDD
jgi:hypothetical protein